MKFKYKSGFSNIFLILIMAAAIFFSNSVDVYAEAVASRFGGANRYDTAVLTSQNVWKGKADTVIIVGGLDFPDALSAAPLAKKYNAPVLLSGKNELTANTLNEISRLGAKKAFIVGGLSIIPSKVESQLSAKGISCERIAGSNRYETSTKVAERIGTSNGVVAAAGLSFADALAIAPIAAKLQMPILLTPKDSLSPYTATYIQKNNIPKTYVIGGTGVISDTVAKSFKGSVERISGKDRYETNTNIINRFKANIDFNKIYIASGTDFADALVAAPAASMTASPLIMVTESERYSKEILDRITGINSNYVNVMGGTTAISDNMVSRVIYALNTFKVEGIE